MLQNSQTIEIAQQASLSKFQRIYYLLPLLILGLVSGFVFQEFLFNKATFIGAIDRFAYLGIRKFQVDAIQRLGLVPSWCDSVFMGYSIVATHFMQTTIDVLAWFQSLFPIDKFFIVTTYITFALQLCTAIAAYAFINNVLQDRFAAIIGAILYTCSEGVTIFTAQGDNNIFIFLLLPLGLLCIRKLFLQYHIKYLLGFSFITIFLPTTSVLQLTAYVFILFGSYALFLSVNNKQWRVLFLMGLCFAVGIIIALPRMYSILLEVKTLERPDWVYSTSSIELLRWIYDGIMGRTPSELPSTYRYSMHDGLQMFTAVPAFFALIILGSLVFIRGKLGKLLFPIFLVAVLDIFWMVGIKNGQLQYYFISLLLFTSVFACWALYNSRTQGISLDANVDFKELAFFSLFLFACMAVVFLPEARNIIRLLFFKVDFIHSRICVVAILIYTLLTAYFIKTIFGTSKIEWTTSKTLILVCSIALAALIIQISNNVWMFESKHGMQTTWFLISDKAALYVGILFTVFMLLMFLRSSSKKSTNITFFLCSLIACLMAWDAMYYAKWQLAGAHTKSNIAFALDELYTTKPGKFIVPSEAEVQTLQQHLNNAEYRSAFVGSSQEFAGFYGSYLAQFWRLRLIEGYGAGVPKRLTRLPWPDGVNDVRQLRFTNWNDVPWDILALLNVKNVISLKPDLYFNNFSTDDAYSQLDIRDNPYKVIPRVFFAKKIVPLELNLQEPRIIELPQPVLAVNNTSDVVVSWHKDNNYNYDLRKYIVERKTMPDGEFKFLNRSPLNNFIDRNLDAGIYCYRLKGTSFSHNVRYLQPTGAEQCIAIPAANNAINAPTDLQVKNLDRHNILVSWQNALSYLEYAITIITDTGSTEYRTKLGESSYIISVNDIDHGVINIKSCFEDICSATFKSISFNLANAIKSYPQHELRLASGATISANPIEVSNVEGISTSQEFSTAGEIAADFNNDKIVIHVTPETTQRFLVLNEMFHHTWKAYAAGHEIQIFPVNLAMRGVIVPPDVDSIEFRNEPFMFSFTAILIMAFGGVLWLLTLFIAPLIVVRSRKIRYTAHF